MGQTAGTNAGVGGQTGVREDKIAVLCVLLGTVDGGFIVNEHGLHEFGVRSGFLKSGRECFICGVPIASDMQNVRPHLSGKLDHLVGIVGQHDGHGGDATTLAFVENAVHAFDWHAMCRNATILHRHQSNVVGTSLHGFDGLIVFDQRIDLLDYHCRFSLCLYGLMDV